MNRILTFTLLSLCGVSFAHAADWPGFRGPDGTGISPEKDVPLKWSATNNVKWKAPLPHPANGSPIVSNGRVFVTSAEDPDGLQRSLYCFDRIDGSQLWKRTATIDKKMPTHQTNPYCGSTPAANGEFVVVWHASAGLYCYDLDGNEVWSRQLGDFKHMWGYGTSPVLYRDRVIMFCSPGERNSMAAIDLATGRTLWETAEPHRGTGDRREDGNYMGSWCTPIITNIDGRDQIVCTMPNRVAAFDPDDGHVIWHCDGIRGPRGDLAYSSPVVAGDMLVAIGGFQGPAIGLRPGGTGNITAERRIWRREKNPQNIGSGVYVDGYLYRPNAGPGTIECLDPKTGEVVWEDRAAGANHWGSIIVVAGHCLVTNQDGTTVVFRPSPAGFQLVAENELGEGSNSTPAVSDGEVFIRTFDHIFCISE